MREMYGAVYEDLRLHKSIPVKQFLVWPMFYFVRRIILAATVVFLRDNPMLQQYLLMWQSLMTLVIQASCKPFAGGNKKALTELLNEAIILVCVYHMQGMAGIAPEVQVKHWIGYSLVGILAVWTAYSLSVIVKNGIVKSYKAIRGVSAERKQAKEHNKIRADLQKKYASATFISDFKQKTRLEFELNRASQVEENPDLEVNEESPR